MHPLAPRDKRQLAVDDPDELDGLAIRNPVDIRQAKRQVVFWRISGLPPGVKPTTSLLTISDELDGLAIRNPVDIRQAKRQVVFWRISGIPPGVEPPAILLTISEATTSVPTAPSRPTSSFRQAQHTITPYSPTRICSMRMTRGDKIA
jgi:hypothetical protein